MNNDGVHYTKDKLFSYRGFLNFSIGERGVGKTMCAKFWSIDDFLKTGNRFIWVRRYSTEIKGDAKKGIKGCAKTFFDKMKPFYPKHKFEVKGGDCYIDGKLAGTFVALSTSSSLKGVDFPDYNKIIFDEFLIVKGSKYHYCDNEPTLLLDLISTVFRPITDKDGNEVLDGKVWLLSNAITFANDYFFYFDIKPFHKRFYNDKERGIVVEQGANKEYREAVKKTKFAKLVKGTDYEDYAINNEYMLDNDNFIEKKSNTSDLIFNIRYENHRWGVWADSEFVYISNKVDNSRPYFVFTKEDHSLDSYLIKNARGTKFEILVNNYRLGLVRFDSIMIKQKFMDFLKLFISK